MVKRRVRKPSIDSLTSVTKFKEERDFFDYFWKFVKWVVIVGITSLVMLLIVGLFYFDYYTRGLDTINLDNLSNTKSSRIYDRDGNEIAELGKEQRVEVTIDEVPKLVVDSLVSVEDARFWYHKGVDPIRVISSALNNVLGRDLQGGSTLTQQLSKLSFLDPDNQTLERKVHEALISWKLEEDYNKEDLLEYYINKVYMGNGVYGFESAALYYFDKNLDELSISQTAIIAGIPNAPNFYNPYNSEELTEERRNQVLYRMLKTESISEEEYRVAINTAVTEGLVEQRSGIYKEVDKEYQEYIDQVFRQLQGKGIDLLNGEYYVYTYIDTQAQEELNRLVYDESINHLAERELDMITAVVGVKDGGVRAVAGGNSKKELGVFDGFSYSTDGKVQVGSTLKPILAYAPALEYEGMKMSFKLEDKPYKYTNGVMVNNYDNQYYGSITLDKALRTSRNTVALELQNRIVGLEESYRFGNSVGLNIPSEEWVESGTLSASVSVVDLASAYTIFANRGEYIPKSYVSVVKDGYGNVVYKQEDTVKVMSKSKSDDLAKTMYTIVNGGKTELGSGAKVEGYNIIGKTGTTNYGDNEIIEGVPSVTFAGTTPDVSIVVHVQGENRKRPLIYEDGDTKLAIKWFKDILPKVSQDHSQFKFE